MKYLVDAKVLSEATRTKPDPTVVAWLEAHEAEIVIDAIVLGELAVGVAALPGGRKRSRLEAWFEALVATVECLPWDAAAAREWARLVVELRRRGRAMPLTDSMIAATARSHGLILVARNIRDFEPAGLDLVNPFPASDPPDAVQEHASTYRSE
jgi:predicted nucleic acid-binding protein